MVKQFEGKRVLVTGGGGGLGLTIVTQFVRAGATVFALDNNKDLLESLGKKFPPDKVIPVLGNLGQWDEITKIFQGCCPLNHLVNNAAVCNKIEPLPNVTEESIDRALNVNFKACFNLSQAFAKNVIENGIKDATIVNISGVAGKLVVEGASVYTCSKAALEAMTKCFAVEMGPYGVRVNCIAPAAMGTPLLAALPPNVAKSFERLIERQPIKGNIELEDAANLVLYLASEQAKMITGTVIPVDGGLMCT